MDESFIQFDTKHGIEKLHLTDLFILQIANLYGRHNFLTPFE
jgi:hypothetical protein